MREGFKSYSTKRNKEGERESVYGNIITPSKQYNDKRFPVSVLKFNSIQKAHKTQKPVDLCEWLINSYSNEGDTVLDFTMGSGSTGWQVKTMPLSPSKREACKKLPRREG
jgi:site-specific DNA-methyltransferase (adenine-specific)